MVDLSKRQVEVLTLKANGYTAIQVAEMLRISRKTVEVHLKFARAKLGTRSTESAIAVATKDGLIKP